VADPHVYRLRILFYITLVDFLLNIDYTWAVAYCLLSQLAYETPLSAVCDVSGDLRSRFANG